MTERACREDIRTRPGLFPAIYGSVVHFLGLAVFALMCVLWFLPAGGLYLVLPRRQGAILGQYVIMRSFRAYLWLLRMSGLVKLDLGALDVLREEYGLLIAANHPSGLDVVLVASRLPRLVCIAKTDLISNPVLGLCARLAGYVQNEPPWCMVQDAASAVRNGSLLLVFPEGTRTEPDLLLNPFKSGFGMIAERADAPVQSIFIETNSRFLGKGWYWLKKPEFPLVYRVRLGQRFEPGLEARELVRRMESYYMQDMKQTALLHREEA